MPASQNTDVHLVLRLRGTERCQPTGRAAGGTQRSSILPSPPAPGTGSRTTDLLNPRGGGGDTEVSSANWRLPARALLEIQPSAALSSTVHTPTAATPALVTTLIDRHSPERAGSAQISATSSELAWAECCAICRQGTVAYRRRDRRATPRRERRSTP